MPTILTDIEGTTSSISFVHETLFPLAKKELTNYLRTHENDPNVVEALQLVRNTLAEEKQNQQASLECCIEYLHKWIEQDRKHSGLKLIQGLIWQLAYENGQIKGHVYKDAAEQLKSWHAKSWTLAIYSSGSIQAQKLLFGFSVEGNLNYLFETHFDTTIGSKKDFRSYERISQQLKSPIVFLSDIDEELESAQKAGMQVIQLDRAAKLSKKPWPVARDFYEVNKIIEEKDQFTTNS